LSCTPVILTVEPLEDGEGNGQQGQQVSRDQQGRGDRGCHQQARGRRRRDQQDVGKGGKKRELLLNRKSNSPQQQYGLGFKCFSMLLYSIVYFTNYSYRNHHVPHRIPSYTAPSLI
jgi:hypothetical protein